LSLRFWSTRTSSSRQVVGLATVTLTAGNPPFVVLASGMIAKSAVPVAVGVTVKEGDTWGPVGQSLKLPGVPLIAGLGQRSAKFPPRSASDGTFCRIVVELFSLRHSCDQNTKVF